jgi:uncharacterized protein (TIGR02145 family)
MSLLSSHILSKSLFTVIVIICFYSCDTKEPILNPDYTGQIGQLTDIQGNVYKTIGIGSQIWMAENLRTTQLDNGQLLPNVKDESIWHYFKTSGYCYYNNDSVHYHKNYGPLYNFFVVNTDSICPVGWHVPSEEDWQILADYLGGTKVAGGKLKDFYGDYWKSPNPCITNNFNFFALPGGYRKFDTGQFSDKGYKGYWWTSTTVPKNEGQSWVMTLSNENKYLVTNYRYKNEGVSLRCIKNK